MNDTAEKESCGKCPDCDQLVIEFPKLFTCQNKECDFKIWKKVAQKELSQAQVKQILETGKSELIEGFTSKAGKPSSAFLEWNSEKKQTSFVFDNKATT